MSAPWNPTAVQFTTVNHTSSDGHEIAINVALSGPEQGQLLLFVHGWPENWHSWRFQLTHFAAQGYRCAAMDVRGYGGTSRPDVVMAYRLSELAGDVAAVAAALSPSRSAVVVGHDWGAPIAWNTARLYPERVAAVVGMSVPYRPATDRDPFELWDAVYADRFFYMHYILPIGVPEAAFGADLPAALRKMFYSGSGDAPLEVWAGEQPRDAALLDFLVDPEVPPDWMDPEAIAGAVAAHGQGPLHGWFHRYRAQPFDGADIEHVGDPILRQPSCFIAGAKDMVRSFVPGHDAFSDVDASLSDFRGSTIIEGVGHWVQQEAPDDTNAALERFLAGL